MLRKRRVIFLIVLIGFLVLIVFKGIPFILGNFKYSDRVIIIDAGHGGKDPGAIGFNGNYEKDIALEISKKLRKRLKRKGYKIISTRNSDEYVDNLERAKLANKNGGRIFISIHGNSTENNSTIDGVQVLHYPNNGELAQTMMDSIINRTGATNRGVIEREDLIVLNQTRMPAIIIECGFLSNLNEEKLLLTENYQNKIVDSIVDGLEEYFSMSLVSHSLNKLTLS